MPTPVVMPQMGESIAEGTIVRWIKKVGDSVDRDEPLFEISTDKVDAEIPSPAAGVLTEIKVSEGETVAVNEVVATIADQSEAVGRPSRSREDEAVGRASRSRRGAAPEATAGETPANAPSRGAATAAASTQPQPDGADPVASKRGRTNGSGEADSKDDLRRQKSSPLVRRIAREHNVDISGLHGSGIGGRVTKHDILEYLEHPPSPPPVPPPSPVTASERVEVQPLSVMRRKIAEHMVMSRRTSAHVHSVFHVDFSLVGRIRQQKKAEYERLGAKLTYMAFIAKATIDALRRHPIINASMDEQHVIYRKDINLGVAVALDTGLIVPVIRNADEKNMLGLTRSIADVADRARARQLKPEEVQGGTFTITNPGQFGAQFGMPIINQPQVAILGIGTIEKRPVVIDDAIAIRTMAYLTLGFDHRLIDGAVADEFMADIKQQIEHFDPNQV
jgi:2-oxoglutarate dehydrogenase E2 component (dihydrolipoamide succinyltransferase)